MSTDLPNVPGRHAASAAADDARPVQHESVGSPPLVAASGSRAVTLFLCGDVMTGRGIDQVLPHHCPPELYEPYVQSAVEYVRLAEQVHGRIPAPADFAYVWGDAPAERSRQAPAVRIANLETAVAPTARTCAPGKSACASAACWAARHSESYRSLPNKKIRACFARPEPSLSRSNPPPC